MIPIEDKTRTFTIVPLVTEGPGLVKELHSRNQLTFRSGLLLFVCFLLGVAAAGILLYTFF